MNENTPSVPSAPFADFLPELGCQSAYRARITEAWRLPETLAIPALLEQARLPEQLRKSSQELAYRIADHLRHQSAASGGAGIVQGLLQEFSLSSEEGVALMCLAEALLRIPDTATRDALIRDKITQGQWQSHLGHSASVFVNAATWGLLVTGKVVAEHNERGLSAALARLLTTGGEPLIRKGMDMGMRMLGEQFVTGETITRALANSRRLEAEGFRYSYDMLGEAALTAADAERYLRAYEQAIAAIGQASAGRGVVEGPGISIKLSALHPRYCRAQSVRVMAELYPLLLRLCRQAKEYDIGLNIDAEESERLELSLELLARLCFAPELHGWQGIGFVVQAYQKRCPFVIDYLIDLAQRSQHRLMIRLVKGAYWDSEIKRAQIDGQDGYPVFTRKPYTDISYLACAKKLLAATETVYPQFATHNAQTLAAIYQMADPAKFTPGQYEFQCLHGMGEALYLQVVGASKLGRPCRIYAPVGTHETLLAYLVRRLLENGANTSFVNRISDATISLDALIQDPVDAVEQMAAQDGVIGLPHPAIALPAALYGASRKNSRGLDLADELQLLRLASLLADSAAQLWHAAPMLAAEAAYANARPVHNPADHADVVGRVQEATASDVDAALGYAVAALPAWTSSAPGARADMLEAAADLFDADMPRLMGLLMREAGKSCANAIAEVREAVDFLRFYAAQSRRDFSNATHQPLGIVVCISPWNFPLAIFTGQLAAALAAGNVVLAKPAEQTPLIAAVAVRLLWQAGVPRGAVQLLPGQGELVGAQLVNDARIAGVMFTGSTEVARILQRSLAARLSPHGYTIPLIAETGGQNAMIVDSSALAEQVVTDVLVSAFDSAGQRCSALRVLCIQDEAFAPILAMLKGAMQELKLGNPTTLATDVGPVIDAEAKASILRHIEAMRAQGRKVFQPSSTSAAALAKGSFVLPTLIEIDSLHELQNEIFGPVLHLLRYQREDMAALLDDINGTGFGLTMGIHTRINETMTLALAKAKAGNVYINRNMVGAVVGVQPFGGEGLSGTGPKAGGPMYLYRLLARRPDDAMQRAMAATGGAVRPGSARPSPTLAALQAWAERSAHPALAGLCAKFAQQSCRGTELTLAGPTGECNTYSLHPREMVLCLAEHDDDRLAQLAAVLAVGSRPLWPGGYETLLHQLPVVVQEKIVVSADWKSAAVEFDAVLHHGSSASLLAIGMAIARRPGAIISVHGFACGDVALPLESLVIERSLSVNTAAAGGNASLLTLS